MFRDEQFKNTFSSHISGGKDDGKFKKKRPPRNRRGPGKVKKDTHLFEKCCQAQKGDKTKEDYGYSKV